jgi:uncharacterized protein (TIGR02300 family)
LSRDPIICPKCGTIYQVVAAGAPAAVSRARPEPVAQRADEGEEALNEETSDVELVSLEDAEEGTPGSKAPASDEDLDVDEDLGDEEENAFLVEDESDEDVSDLIDGDIEDDEEA